MGEDGGQLKYHYGFYAAAHVAYHAVRGELEFLQEQELGVEPVRLDMLIIKRNGIKPLEDPIGSFFRKYNILEYKSPEDTLNIDDFIKTQGYACFYKAQGKVVNEIPCDELTISVFRHTFPRKLFASLAGTGRGVENPYPGIYHVAGPLTFPAQVVVTSQLPAGSYTAFKILARGAGREDVIRFMESRGAYDPEDVRAILRISIATNQELFLKLEEEGLMVDAFERVFHKELAEREARGEERGIFRTLLGLVRDGILSAKDAALRAGITEAEFLARMQASQA